MPASRFARLTALVVAVLAVLGLVPEVAAAADRPPTKTVNRWSVGLYRGASHPDYIRLHEDWLGRPIETALEMIAMDSWSRIDDPTKVLNAWRGTHYDVVFTTPLIPKDGTSTLAAGADGAYDEHWRKFASAFVAAGRGNARIRLGHEFNHTWYPWSAANGKEAAFAAYYRRVVTVMRSVPGAAFRFTWNVLSGVTTADVEAAYPGDAYVDVISLDLYDGSKGIADFDQRWKSRWSQPYGLTWLQMFATAHGKQMAFDEWALIKSNNPAQRDPSTNSGDDTVFINGMFDFFEQNDVAYANYFDANTRYGSTDSRIMDGPYPNATAAYRRRLIGNGSDTPVTTPPATVPPTNPSTPPAPVAPSGGTVLVVGDASNLPNKDEPLRARLVGRGMTPRLVDDDALSSAVALGSPSLVFISSSVVPSKIPAWMATVPAPIVTAEVHVQPLLGLATAARERPATSTISISSPTSPLAAGLTGEISVQSATTMATSTPAPGTIAVATERSTGEAAVIARDAAAGRPRRVGLFLSYDSPPALTAAGWRLVDAAIDWAGGAGSPSRTRVAPGAAIVDGVATIVDGSLVVLADGAPPSVPVVGGAATPTGAGAWSVTSDGRVFTAGDARSYGSRAGTAMNAPIVAITPTPSGRGYWLLGADGGIYSFGDAAFFGSTGAMRLNQPVVGMAATATGRGYWLFAGDGGIFTFGDAGFFGSTGALRLNAPITTMAPTPNGGGYWLLGADGGVFTFGNARFHGSTGADRSVGAIEAIVPTSSGAGYWLIGRDARVHAFGDAR